MGTVNSVNQCCYMETYRIIPDSIPISFSSRAFHDHRSDFYLGYKHNGETKLSSLYIVVAADVLLLNMFISFDLFIRFSMYLKVYYVFYVFNAGIRKRQSYICRIQA